MAGVVLSTKFDKKSRFFMTFKPSLGVRMLWLQGIGGEGRMLNPLIISGAGEEGGMVVAKDDVGNKTERLCARQARQTQTNSL